MSTDFSSPATDPLFLFVEGHPRPNPFGYLAGERAGRKRQRLQSAMSLLKLTGSYLASETYRGQSLFQIYEHWTSLGWVHPPASRATLLSVYAHPELPNHKLVVNVASGYATVNVLLTDRAEYPTYKRLFESNIRWHLGKNEAGTRVLQKTEIISSELANPAAVLDVLAKST